MARYKNINVLEKNDSTEFDKTHAPGTLAPNAGIYRCTGCGHEIGIAETHPLPPHPHVKTPAHTIAWQLVVFALHKE